MPNVVTPSLRQLRYLVELRETGHFGRAAAALGVGQSTLSSGIAELDRLIGMLLVERTQRSLRFADIGETFVLRARSVLDATSALTDFAIAAAKPLTGTLRLGIIPTVAPFLLPRALGALRAEFPQLNLHVREMTSERACALRYQPLDTCVGVPAANPPYRVGMPKVVFEEVPSRHVIEGVSEPAARHPSPHWYHRRQHGACTRRQKDCWNAIGDRVM